MAELLTGADLPAMVSNLVSEKTQVRDFSLDLTVHTVSAIRSISSLDFGGSEYKESDLEALEPVKKSDDDKYGWWNLKKGTYLINLNEEIMKHDGIGFISPHPNILKAGCTHPTLFTLEWKKEYILPLHVGENGVEIKENAKVSKLVVLK